MRSRPDRMVEIYDSRFCLECKPLGARLVLEALPEQAATRPTCRRIPSTKASDCDARTLKRFRFLPPSQIPATASVYQWIRGEYSDRALALVISKCLTQTSRFYSARAFFSTAISRTFWATNALFASDAKASFVESIAASKNGIDRYSRCSIWHDAPGL